MWPRASLSGWWASRAAGERLESPKQDRSTLQLKERKDLALFGIAILALLAFLFLFISYQLVFMGYALVTIFVFISYLLLWNESGQKECKLPAPKRWPTLSIIIPSYNSKGTIFRCVEACKSARYAGKREIVVIDDRSTDGSYEELLKCKGITVHRKEKNAGKAAALNFGIGKTDGEIIACIDSDTYLEENTLEEAVKCFFKEGKGEVGASVVFVQSEKPTNLLQSIQEIEYWLSFGFFFKTIASIGGMYVTPGPTALYRRSMFEKLGGYDEQNISEDLEIALRLHRNGYRIESTHEAFVRTETPTSLKALMRQRVRWYRGGIANIIKYMDLFLNPKYGQLGLFVLPTMLGSGFFAAIFMGWALLFWLRGMAEWLVPFIYDFGGGIALTQAGLGNGMSFIHSGWILWLFSIFLWAYFLIISFELAGEEPKPRHALPLVCMLTVYPIFIGIAFLISYLYEFFGVKYTW